MQAHEFIFEDDEDYRIPHRAPMHDSGSPLYDVTGTYPDDIYGPNAIQYYGTREPWDSRSIRVIQLSRNKPNQTIQIFRAVPKEVKSNTINPGDWVTASREYATQHGKGLGKYKLLSKIVPAKTLFTNGDSIHEWGYDPGGAAQPVAEGWSQKYKSSINCAHPKGFSQRAHCAGKKKQNESIEMEMVCEDCGMCETHQGHEHLDEACWKGYHKEGNKKMFGKTYPNCVKNTKEDIDEAGRIARKAGQPANSKKHSDLYTDENPRGTITGLKFATVEDARSSVSKIRNSGRSHAHKVQAAVAMEQRARAAGKATAAAVYRAYINSVKKTDEQQVMTMTENQDELTRILELSTGLSATDRAELNEEFDLIESIIHNLADRNGVDVEAIWEDLDSLTDDELYVSAVTTPVMEDWQKANKQDRTSGMSQKAVNAYRRENPGSKLKTAVTTKPSKLKKGSKASKRRKSYCSRSRGQMKMHSISCAKTPDKAICKARRRWNC